MSELKACPFCGNYKGDENNDAPHICFSVLRDAELAHCEVCGAEVHAHGKDPRVTWNTRPIEDKLQAELARLTAELAELRERFDVTDDLLNQATVTIGAVIACCTYNSNEDAKIGIYGISPDAFTRIDQFITNYNRAVADGKVSVDVKPVQRPADPSLEEDEFDSMPIEKINQYLREHGYNPEKVGLRGKILAEALTKNIIAREIIQRFLNNEGGCRFCDYDKYLPLDAPKNGHEEDCLYLAARAYLDNDTSTVVKRDLSDAEIEELGAHEAESRSDK